MTTKYFAQLCGNNIISQPVPLAAQDIPAAKVEAWDRYGDGFNDHWIEICEAAEFTPGEVEAGRALLSRRLTDRAWQAM